MALVTRDQAKSISDRFLDLLSHNRIDPVRGSGIEDDILSLVEIIETFPANLDSRASDPARIYQAAAFSDFAAKVLSAETLDEFKNLLPHLRLLAAENQIATVNQAGRIDPRNDVVRKLTELYVGILAAHCGHVVRLDHPSRSSGDNPDIIVDLVSTDGGKQCLAIAVKSIISNHGQTIFDRIREGAEQIDRADPNVDYGAILINVQGAIDHAMLQKVVYPNVETAAYALARAVTQLWETVEHNRPQSEWECCFGGRAKLPIAFMAHSVVRINTPQRQGMITPLKLMKCFTRSSGDTNKWILRFWGHINHFMQSIVRGNPGCVQSGVKPS